MRLARTGLLALGLLAACASHADEIIGRVVSIADGDTMTVLDASNTQHKIWLEGIDAPERGQPFGTRSRQNLSDLVFGKDVRVDWHKRDRYGRVVGKVWVTPSELNCTQEPCPKTLDAGRAQPTVGLLAAWAVDADEIVGRVVSVADGDTVTILDATNTQHKIRLQGIDAPERGQPFGARSRQNLSYIVFGNEVRMLAHAGPIRADCGQGLGDAAGTGLYPGAMPAVPRRGPRPTYSGSGLALQEVRDGAV